MTMIDMLWLLARFFINCEPASALQRSGKTTVDQHVHRVAIVLEEESRDHQAVLADGEVERLAILVMCPSQRRIAGDQGPHRREVACRARLK